MHSTMRKANTTRPSRIHDSKVWDNAASRFPLRARIYSVDAWRLLVEKRRSSVAILVSGWKSETLESGLRKWKRLGFASNKKGLVGAGYRGRWIDLLRNQTNWWRYWAGQGEYKIQTGQTPLACGDSKR